MGLRFFDDTRNTAIKEKIAKLKVKVKSLSCV